MEIAIFVLTAVTALLVAGGLWLASRAAAPENRLHLRRLALFVAAAALAAAARVASLLGVPDPS